MSVRLLDTSRHQSRHKSWTPYSLHDPNLPFGLTFAQRRPVVLLADLDRCAASQSDGATSGSDGSNPSVEDFDWIDDD